MTLVWNVPGIAQEPTDDAEQAAQDTSPQDAPQQTGADRTAWLGKLDEKLRWKFVDDQLTLSLGASFQFDGTAVWPSGGLEQEVGELDNSVDVRRARIQAEGLFRRTMFRASYDFGVNPGPRDIFLPVLDRQQQNWIFRLGLFNEPFGLERLESGLTRPFMEMGLPETTFGPGRSAGMMLFHPAVEERMTWAAGAFTGGALEGAEIAKASDLTFTGRLTGLPIYQGDGQRLLHLGLAASLRKPQDDQLQYRSRPEARFLPYFVDTGQIAGDRATMLGLELAGIAGPSWFMAEAMGTRVSSAAAGDPSFHGASLQVGYILSGESRLYDKKHGTFGATQPADPYHSGPLTAIASLRRPMDFGGAWELVGRISHVDLDDAQVQGGKLTDLSAGLNWWLDSYRRMQLNYVYSALDSGEYAHIALLRFQFAF